MSTVRLRGFWKDKGVPKTGLSPTVNIWKDDGTLVVTAGAMTEIAGGFYFFEWTAYDNSIDYSIRMDGTSTLSNTERYIAGSSDELRLAEFVERIKKVESNRWKIVGTQQIFYDDDGTTPLLTFDLKNKSGNPTNRDVFERVAP